jgi:hypothetical protein
MAKELVIGQDPHGPWRLPPHYDIEALRTDLEEAFAKGTFAWVSIEPEGPAPGHRELIINGRVVPFVVIVESTDSAG